MRIGVAHEHDAATFWPVLQSQLTELSAAISI